MQARVSFGIGVALMLALTLVFWVTDWDPRGPALGYRPEIPHWRWAKSPPCVFFQRFGTWPGLALVVGAGAGFLLSLLNPARASWRFPCLFIIAVTAIGPGLLVNVVFKNLVGRHRPYETVLFGGTQPFLRPFEIGTPFHGASFMSGHAAMAFLFVCLFFVLDGWKRWAAVVGGLALGLAVGSVRVLRGDHFPSDVLLAGALDFTLAAGMMLFTSKGRNVIIPVPQPDGKKN
jgi:membrane-associated phospholipid phosphatase